VGWASQSPRPREERAGWAGSKEFRSNLEKEGKIISKLILNYLRL
jgi:hypothetical protein